MLKEITRPSGTLVHQLPPGEPLTFFIACFIVIVFVALVMYVLQLHHYFVSNHFISADMWFVLSFLFDSCQINSHNRLV